MIEKKRVIDFVKIGENTNIVKLSSAYDTNCSMQEFEIVDDRTLQCMLDSEREMDSFQRNERNHVVSLPEDEVKAAKMGAVTVSVEEKYFSEYDSEQINEILDVLSKLTYRQRKRIYMKFCLKMTYTAIGLSEGVAPASVQESCERALRKLSEYSDILQNTTIKTWTDLLV